MTYKERFKQIVKENIKRDGIEKLMEMLEKSDFYIAPASTKYHDSEPEGLVKHSLNVYDWLIKNSIATNKYSLETLTIVALFHDLCKVGFYKTSMRNVKNEKQVWVQVPFYEVDDKLPLGHGEKSVFMAIQHLELTMDEIMAIRWHMGGFVSPTEYATLGQAMSEFDLIVHLHYADLCATYMKG